MSYVALATDRFEECAAFYGEKLGFPVVSAWDRPVGRGRRYDLGGGLKLELLDNVRERVPLTLFPPGGRTHVVVEVDDIDEERRRIRIKTPEPTMVSWGARLFQLHDPDEVPVTFLQWL